MPLASKRITGKGNEVRLSWTQRCPVDLDSGRPEFTQSAQKSVAVIGVLNGVTHEPNGAVPTRPLRMPHRRTGQAAAGTDFDKDSTRIGQHHV